MLRLPGLPGNGRGLSNDCAMQRITLVISTACAVLLTPELPAQPARTGSWGDQGDGTYRNPILNAEVIVKDAGGTQVGKEYTNNKGKATIKNLTSQAYTVKATFSAKNLKGKVNVAAGDKTATVKLKKK